MVGPKPFYLPLFLGIVMYENKQSHRLRLIETSTLWYVLYVHVTGEVKFNFRLILI